LEDEGRLVIERWLLHPDVLEGSGDIPEWVPFDGGGGISAAGDLEEDLAAGAYGRTLLLDGVEELEIAYFGILEGEQDPDWNQDWLEQSRLPIAVRIHLTTTEQTWPDMLIRLPQIDQRSGNARR
jgi:general secretion pathway protein J